MSDKTAIALGLTAAKAAGSAAIGFFFLVMVMIATAQQDVLTRMKGEGLAVGYSAALSLREKVAVKAERAGQLRIVQAQLGGLLDSTQSTLEESQRDFDIAWEGFRPSIARLTRANLCDLSVQAADSGPVRWALANEVRECQLDSSAGPGAERVLASARTQAERFLKSSTDYFTALARLRAIDRQLAATKAQLDVNQVLTKDEDKAARSFGDMEVLLKPWVLFGNALVQFPPPLLQILLTFVSGLFGALLVTMILVVYPNNSIATASNARPVTRTFLGGFIAICLYIILLGGTAVLGSASSDSGAGTNYMAFCGLGILAGMFSDRVAGWLSERADEFFKSK